MSSLTMVFCLTIPATLGLIVLAEPIIRLIFEHGAFSSVDTEATAIALSLYAVGLFAYSANKVIVPVYYAINATRYPVIGSFFAIAVNIIIIKNTIDIFQHKAIALSTSVTMILNFFFLLTVLYYKIGGYSLKYLFQGFWRIITAALIMTVLLQAAYSRFSDFFTNSIISQCILLALLIFFAIMIYAAVLHVLKLPELFTLTERFRQLISKK